MLFRKNALKKDWNRLVNNHERKYRGFTANFNKGISKKEWDKYESEFGFELPESMKDLYLLCNGDNDRFIAGSILGMKLLSLDKVYSEWKVQKELLASLSVTDLQNLNNNCTSVEPRKIKCYCFNNLWIPIADDSGGNYIGIDLDPDDNGKVGQIINFGSDENEKIVIANSLNEFVVLIADIIVSDKCVIKEFEDEYVFVFDGHWHAIDYLKARKG
jgi:cell wall assembly regulator SMI1